MALEALAENTARASMAGPISRSPAVPRVVSMTARRAVARAASRMEEAGIGREIETRGQRSEGGGLLAGRGREHRTFNIEL